jgi:hypothetical protein
MAGRPKNPQTSATVTISVTPTVRAWLEELAVKGPYGKTASEVAARFVDERLQRMLEQGFIRYDQSS